jgi:hypothetical protein
MDGTVFEAVLMGISDEGFLDYIDRLLDQKAAALSWKHDHLDGHGYSNEHLQAHAEYCAIYESRVRSVLKQHHVDLDAFTARCSEELTAKPSTDNGSAASTRDVAETMLGMLEWVADFQAFATMLASRNDEPFMADSPSDD